MFDNCQFSVEHNLSRTSQLFRSSNNFCSIWIVEQPPVEHPNSRLLLQLLRKIKRYFLLLKLSWVKLSLTQNIAQECLKTKSILEIGVKTQNFFFDVWTQKSVACFQNYLISKKSILYVFWAYILNNNFYIWLC